MRKEFQTGMHIHKFHHSFCSELATCQPPQYKIASYAYGAWTRIERSTYVIFNAPFLQKFQPGVRATLGKLYLGPGIHIVTFLSCTLNSASHGIRNANFVNLSKWSFFS